MKKQKFLHLAMITLLSISFFGGTVVNAASLKLDNNDYKHVVKNTVEEAIQGENESKEDIIVEDEVVSVCDFDIDEEKNFGAEFITVRRKLRVETGEEFKVKVFFKNTGNTPWFKSDGECSGPRISLKTSKNKTRKSVLYPKGAVDDSNWESASSIRLDQQKVEPGKIGSFSFTAKAPASEDILKEYFTPYIWGEDYLDDSEFSFNVIVGHPEFTYEEMRKKMEYSFNSGSVMSLDLNGPRSLVVDLSDQEVELKLGDTVIKKFPVSTGKASTPTPIGSYKISLKQDVRISHGSPHYIMPKFMWFRAGGYGFHALPSVQHGDGRFWTEARNHIGRPVSHGCVRLLPEDADYIYDFSNIGTEVTIKW